MSDAVEALREEIAALKDAVVALTMAINMSACRVSPTYPGFPPGLTDIVPYHQPPVLAPAVPFDPLDWTRWSAPPPTTCGPLISILDRGVEGGGIEITDAAQKAATG